MFRLSPLFQFKHGDHICLFYRTQDDLMEVLTPYVAEGILKGEKVFCAQKPETLKRLVHDLRFIGMEPEDEMKRGALELHTEDEAYFPQKQFDPSVMMELLNRSIDESLERGFSAFRSAGELSWATRGSDQCDQVLGYEKMVNEHFPSKPSIGLCQYAVDKFTPEMLDSVLEHHRLHLNEASSKSLHSSMHVRHGALDAEIVVDRFVVDPRYYYVVQQVPKREIVGWGVAPSFDVASAQAEQVAKNGASISAFRA
jgi:hypothetical protein